LKPLVGQKNSS